MKLELKHLAPYLPYGLIINQHREDLHKNYQSEMVALFSDKIKVVSEKFPFSEEIQYYEAKPILRPLSDFKIKYEVRRWDSWEKLFSEHYDVFGLIEKGLAIDINTLKI